MKQFSAQLTREKFLVLPCSAGNSNADQIKSSSVPKHNQPAVVSEGGTSDQTRVASANRLELSLSSKDSDRQEKFIIRGQNMHSCLRVGAHVAYHFYEHGELPETGRKRFEWKYIYKSVTEVYEEKWNPNMWAAIYHKGRPIYKEGAQYEPFLDVVELCMAYDKADYSEAIGVIENMLKQAGRSVDLEYSAEPVVRLDGSDREARMNIVRRGPQGREILKMQIKRKETRNVKASPCLTAAAAIVEAFQLGFFVARVNEQMHHAMLTLSNPEAVQGDHASRRIARMEEALEEFEQMYNVAYRPKSPNFEHFSKDVAHHFDKLYAEMRQERKSMGSKSESPPAS